MLKIFRKLILDVCDYKNNKLCSLYDSSTDIMGQAVNVVVVSERNGSKTLTFNIPTSTSTLNGQLLNFRLSYLKADYRIMLLDLKLKDLYILTSPKYSHSGRNKDVSVTATHISQLLKYKALNLLFSDDEGNNTGTIDALVNTVLEGTGWTLGVCANFYEDDSYDYPSEYTTLATYDVSKKIKQRSVTASTKTGAFKLISTICDKFNAKPIYHGYTRTVDILPLNPFELPDDGSLPDVNNAHVDGVILLHYGNNVKTITRTLNTLNIATRLYIYGNYGEYTYKYLDISQCTHTEYYFYPAYELVKGYTYWFSLDDDNGVLISRCFTPTYNIEAGTKLVYSLLDPASMLYLWDLKNSKAIVLSKGKKGTSIFTILLPTETTLL